MNVPSFDLIRQPWIPCIGLDGVRRELGLAEVVTRAHELAAISDPSPLATFAIHRLLFAIVHRVQQGPKSPREWKALWDVGRFDASKYEKYFEKWKARFDLFHPNWPFLQVGGFETINSKNEPTPAPAARLLPELAAGNNATLFDHHVDSRPVAMSPAEAARAVLVVQAWGLGGGKGPKSREWTHPYMAHAPCVGAVAVLVTRGTLFKTLCANLAEIGPNKAPPFTSGTTDLPTWEREHVRPPEETVPSGYIEFLSWPSRHIRLLPNASGLVSAVFLAQGPMLVKDSGQDNPFAFYEVTTNGRRAIPLDLDRAIWRDSGALFATADTDRNCMPTCLRLCSEGRSNAVMEGAYQVDLHLFGLANEKAKPLAWRAEVLTAPVRLLDSPEAVHLLRASLGAVEEVHKALELAVRQLAYAVLETESKKPDAKDVARLKKRMLARIRFWETMDPLFRTFLEQLDEDAMRAWIDAARDLARTGLTRAANFSEGSIARNARALVLAQQNLKKGLKTLKSATPAKTQKEKSA